MDINTIIVQFKQLVDDFSHHKDFSQAGNKIFKQKQKQLIDFSKNIHSLAVCLVVLLNGEDPTTLYFASQFVKDKLKFQFQQLTQQAIVQTHSKIINIMRTKVNITKIIASNLALCLSFLYIHCYDKLGTALDFFKNTFASTTVPISPNLYYQYLFRYLDGIVCQIDSRRLVIDEMKRNQVLKFLRNQQTQVIMALHSTYQQLSSKNSAIKLSMSDLENVLFSFSQWLKLQQPTKQILLQIHNHSVLQLALNGLSDMQLSQAATQCLLSTIEVVSNPQISSTFYVFIGQNINRLLKCVNKKLEDQQMDQAQNYIKVLSQYGRHAGKKLIDECNNQTFVFLESMVRYTIQPTLQTFQQLSDFWQSIIYFMANRSQSSPLTKQIADSIVGKLYSTYCDRIAYNASEVSQLDSLTQRQLAKLHQSIEDVRDRREHSRYIFQSICSYFGIQRYTLQIIKIISQTPKQHPNYWGKIQSYIYSLRDVVKACVQPTAQICSIVLFFQSFSQKHVIVLKSMLRFYNSLLQMQEKNEQFILKIIQHTIKLLDEPLIGQKAGQVFQKCCQYNYSILIKHLSSMFQLLNRYPQNDSILAGVTFLLKKNPQILATHLPQVLRSPLQKLKQSSKKKYKKSQFDKLFTIIECIPKGEEGDTQLKHTIEILLNQMWPIIKQIIQQPQNPQKDQDRLIERAVKFLKLVMRSIPNQFIKYLRDIFNVVGLAYKKYPINSYIYLFEVTFTVYYKYKQEDLITYLKTLYQDYCTITYKHLGTEQAIVNYQHLADDFIGLNKRIVTYHTKMFLQSGQAQAILQFSIHCLGSSLPRITSSASQLFEIIFMIYWSPYCRQQYKNSDKGEVVIVHTEYAALYEELKKFILPIVPGLLKKLFKFLQTGPVQSARNNTLDCFEAVALAFPNESAVLWTQPLSQLEEDIITQSEKQRLKQSMKKIGSITHTQFLNAEQAVKRLFFTMSNRYLYRKSRAENLLAK